MTTHYEVKISAEDQQQADTILNSLLDKKLVIGGQLIAAPTRFLWKGKINNMKEYVTITSYTTDRHRQAIVEDVRKTSIEEVPMVTFTAFDDLNSELKEWIEKTVA